MSREVNLIGGFYKDNSLTFSAQDTVNWLPVPAEAEGARSPIKLRGLPGLRGVVPPIVAQDNLSIVGNAPDSLPSTAYSYSYAISGGEPPYTVSISAGALPPGLSISVSGQITGTTGATTASYPFTVRVDDSAGNFRTLADSIEVVAAGSSVALSIWNKLIDWYSNETGGATIVGRKAAIPQVYRTAGAGPHSVTVVSSPVGNAIQLSSSSSSNSNGYTSDYGIGETFSYNSEVSIWAIARITEVPPFQPIFSAIRLQRTASFATQAVVIGASVGTNGKIGFWQGVDGSGGSDEINSPQPALNSWFSLYIGQRLDGGLRVPESSTNGSAISAGTPYTGSALSGQAQITLSGGLNFSGTFQRGTPPQIQLSEQAFFRAPLTEPEVNYLHNSGTFRTFDQLKTDAGIP